MKKGRKALIVVLIAIAVLAAVALGVWFFWLKDYLELRDAAPVYVNPVSSIVGLESESTPRYSGVVEPQETFSVRKDDSKIVSEILVEVGDEVHAGDILFRYDNQSMQYDLDQAEIDLDNIGERITTLNRQLTDLRERMKTANAEDQRAYQVEINSIELQIKQEEANSEKKQAEIDRLHSAMENTEVASEVDGVIKEINSTGTSDGYSGTGSNAFISIVSSGDYRVKGTVTELNIGSLSIGESVIVHSRIDQEQTWTGWVDSIDQEASSQQNQNMYYYDPNTGERSSRYAFYVILDDAEGLILGQHVYIEPDTGSEDAREGLWVPAVYVDHDSDGSFVWAKGSDDRLEKRLVILGEYDEATDTYEIRDGLTLLDSIAFPREDLRRGLPTTTDASYEDASWELPDTPGSVSMDEPGEDFDSSFYDATEEDYQAYWPEDPEVLPDKPADDGYAANPTDEGDAVPANDEDTDSPEEEGAMG